MTRGGLSSWQSSALGREQDRRGPPSAVFLGLGRLAFIRSGRLSNTPLSFAAFYSSNVAERKMLGTCQTATVVLTFQDGHEGQRPFEGVRVSGGISFPEANTIARLNVA